MTFDAKAVASMFVDVYLDFRSPAVAEICPSQALKSSNSNAVGLSGVAPIANITPTS
ncbi:hypothetical protein B0G75_12015 [Paraburkholderia sp. BL18I3N2]|nr:hypothetical protein B0G75_12015 [Paraburkholderia sp. BL18I3N2]PRX90728.1 hypothetical protein B0G73_14225 [Paraburkholderia sp. BL25I1N1]